MKVFLLTSGSYSDYGVLAVFSTRELAEAVLARHPGSDTGIEEYDLDPGVVHARDGYYRFLVELDRDTGAALRHQFECFPDDDELGTVVETGKRPPVDNPRDWPPMDAWIVTLKVTCWARDLAHAVKIASEHRRSFLATVAPHEGTTP